MTVTLFVDLPVQSVGPEACETERIVVIEAERDEPRSHSARPMRCATPISCAHTVGWHLHDHRAGGKEAVERIADLEDLIIVLLQ